MTVIGRGDKAVVFFCCYACHRLEPVCEVGTALFHSPVLHGIGDYVCQIDIKGHSVLNGFFELFVGHLGEPFPHNRFVENVRTENTGYVCHVHAFFSFQSFDFTYHYRVYFIEPLFSRVFIYFLIILQKLSFAPEYFC